MNKEITRARARAVLEQSRMDIAMALSESMATQQRLHQLMGITAELYEGITGEEAPDIEVQPRVVRSA